MRAGPAQGPRREGAAAGQRQGNAPAAGTGLHAWAVVAAAALGLSCLAALTLVLARTPGIAPWFGDVAGFRRALAAHVDLALGAWFLACAGLVWGGGRVARALLAAGIALVALTPLLTDAPALAVDYFPLVAHPAYAAGLALLLAGAAAAALPALARPGRGPARGAALLLLLAVALLAAGLGRGLPGWEGAALGALVWAPAHVLQSVFALLLLAAWERLAGAQARPRLVAAAVLAPFAAAAGAAAGAGPWVYTAAMAASGLAVLAAGLRLGPALLRAEAGRREAALVTGGLYGAGVVLGLAIRGDGALVPAHYHAMIGAVTLAQMTVILEITATTAAARWLARAYGGGTALLVAGLAVADLPRKLPAAAVAEGGLRQDLGLGLTALGGGIALAAALAFALSVLARAGRRARAAATLEAGR
ncbi:hypothetical protein [Inmirania thermothiophila]|uniref:Uncharacterized protein n=1 Tax=Inmirania thermothiophila TaxID=1750597 RepID=A0A3N1Y2Z9_9GAMM|nr:hypothetical protein [Inmirania thermothiophila]ROR32911.1 hypothetical protein EDC57_2126 [Inmirania thermothiophila]